MTDETPLSAPSNRHVMQCMEIWKGNQFVENSVASQGMEAWILSRPYHEDSHGGDVHYLSLCIGGVVTRILVADIAGHGEEVGATSARLLGLLRRFMNTKRQSKLVAELNKEFTHLEEDGRFATAIVATFLSNKKKILLTNAGHPRPLWFSSSTKDWRFLDEALHGVTERDCNFPLGLMDDSSYQHFELHVQAGDWLLIYTDALTEAESVPGELLGESGLLALVRRLDPRHSPSMFGNSLLREFALHAHQLDGDDTTLMAIKFTGQRRTPGFSEKIRGYSRWIKSLREFAS